MKPGVRRSLADGLCRALLAMLPAALRSWGFAIRGETAAIADDGKALLFALHAFAGLGPAIVSSHLRVFVASLRGGRSSPAESSIIMDLRRAAIRYPRVLGIVCATGAVASGLAYLAAAGAPIRYLAVNLAALVIGAALLALLGRTAAADGRTAGGTITAMAAALLATALSGIEVEGAARWIVLGGLSIQPSLVLLPMMLVAFARARDALATVGMVAAAAAMALQPDRAMAGMMALSLAVLATVRRDRHVLAALAAAVGALAVTLLRTDTLPAVPFVDRILYSSFELSTAAGIAVLGGSTLLLVPAMVGCSRASSDRVAFAVFAAVWLAAIGAAALGNYPTPIVGYGGSAIIGYVLSLLALPRRADAPIGRPAAAPSARDSGSHDRHLFTGKARSA